METTFRPLSQPVSPPLKWQPEYSRLNRCQQLRNLLKEVQRQLWLRALRLKFQNYFYPHYQVQKKISQLLTRLPPNLCAESVINTLETKKTFGCTYLKFTRESVVNSLVMFAIKCFQERETWSAIRMHCILKITQFVTCAINQLWIWKCILKGFTKVQLKSKSNLKNQLPLHKRICTFLWLNSGAFNCIIFLILKNDNHFYLFYTFVFVMFLYHMCLSLVNCIKCVIELNLWNNIYNETGITHEIYLTSQSSMI